MITLSSGMPLVLSMAAAIVAAGCSRGGLASELDGRKFVSESAVGEKLAKGIPISIEFDDGNLSADGGCNDIGGVFRIEDGVLVVQGLMMTEMGCLDDSGPQEQWLYKLLTSRPTVTLKELRLTLASKAVTLTLVTK